MLVFNSIQIVALVAAGPMLIQWLSTSNFAFAGALTWVAGAAYGVLCIWMCVLVFMGLEGHK